MSWYAFGTRNAGTFMEGPHKGEPYAAGSLIRTGPGGLCDNEHSLVVVTEDREEADAFCLPSWTVVELDEPPEEHILLSDLPWGKRAQ